MPLNSLMRRLYKLQLLGHSHKPVAISKDTFQHNCESDGIVILTVQGVYLMNVIIGDEDGGTKFNKDGTEHSKNMVVLTGSNHE